MRAPRVVLLLLLVATSFAACSGSRGSAAEERRDPNMITAEEIAASNASSLYDVVYRLRPRWMQVRAARTFDMREGEIVVYQGQVFLGNLDALRQLNVDAAYALRYLDGPTAYASLPGLVGRRIEAAIVIYTSPEQVNR